MFNQNVTSPFITNAHVQTQEKPQPLSNAVQKAVANYLQQLNGQDVNDLYELVLSELERPLLEEVMKYTRGNQTRAANLMGINRGTLRKKLKQYGMS
ncbi:MAG: DNA-binding transcriptional regulator Fis [Rheinheimera sp.]|jgi:Fis family transcriptional regulator|uniref:Putative Fis-like DNA-binding protein n=1 Tax=Rheinheimera tilapiae TaxID=875043 RepID=A0ABV6BBX5_9GAMM|nr:MULTISPECIES: DNA-binding transcriptional regulator Fis [Rheinheimera]ALZ75982.1 Fis family transcriptional regulator [Rheinheimera sp. F8]MDZ7871502.1 DNA-binding transcriptional regulator Fis [Rheinheimera sp.]TXH96939.1 MAG: DNA-binding transcriptional regulator Fis [Rheinheimera sp.]